MSNPRSGADGAGVRRALRLLLMLSGHEVNGVSNVELARALGIGEGTCLRTLQVLADEGVAEQLDNKRWRLGPRLVQVAVEFAAGISRAQQRVDEVNQRYTRAPH